MNLEAMLKIYDESPSLESFIKHVRGKEITAELLHAMLAEIRRK